MGYCCAWQRVDTRKQIWLMTYGSACDSITHQMLNELGIKPDECYTVIWRESKYTLFHCSKKRRVSMESLKRATEAIEERYRIVFSAAVFGYDALCCNDAGEFLENHPGFRKMVEMLNADSEDFEWWIDGNESCVRTYRKGLLWKYIENTDPEKMTHKQLASRVKVWAPIVRSHETLQEAYSAVTARLQANEEELKQLRMELKVERELSANLSGNITQLLEEKQSLRYQLVDAGLRPLV